MRTPIPKDDDVSREIDVLGWVACWLYWGGSEELDAIVRRHMKHNGYHRWDPSVGDFV